MDMKTWEIIAWIIGGLAGAAFIGLTMYLLHRGWREENEADPTKMPMPDDMEREDRDKARKKQFKA